MRNKQSPTGKTDLAPQEQAMSNAQETTQVYHITEFTPEEDMIRWLVEVTERRFWRGEYVKAKKVNDDLEDEWCRTNAQLSDLNLTDKQIGGLRRRLRKVAKLKIDARKDMSDCWQKVSAR